jgi:hypothetical protein
MDFQIIIENLSNPALLFFILGILAVQFKSDLEIPDNSSKFISIYLLLSIGFNGGQELSHSGLNLDTILAMSLGFFLAIIIPIITFFLLKQKMSIANAGAIAATYGSISAVTFLTANSFLEIQKEYYSGYMIAVMALMEAPAIVVGVGLIKKFTKGPSTNKTKMRSIFWHSITNGSVFLILGSMVIGYIASDAQAEGIRPFTTDIFKGFLAVFLLDMGISSGRQLSEITNKGILPFAFATLMPFFGGMLALTLSFLVTDVPGNQLLFAILGASASYIAVPAAMKQAVPEANPSIYLPMALGITFPVNVIFGIPLYYYLIQVWG